MFISQISNEKLSSGRINESSQPSGLLENFIVLENTHIGLNLNNATQDINVFLSSTVKPILRLNLVGQPRKDNDANATTILDSAELNNKQLDVPYLEYQVLSTSSAVSDIKSYLTGEAEVGDFKAQAVIYKKTPTSLGGFALESF